MGNKFDKLHETPRFALSNDTSLLNFLSTNHSSAMTDQSIDIDIILTEKKVTFQCKVILLGDAGVGKTSIQNRFVHQRFEEDYFVTIGTGLAVKEHLIGHHTIKFQIWDIAGQPQFHELRKSYYSAASAGIIVYDVTKPDSVNTIPNWIHELWTHNGRGPIPIVLVGNKIDLQDPETDPIFELELIDYITEINARTTGQYGFQNSYISASAKTGQNIEEIFTQIGIHIITHTHSLKRRKNV